MKGYNKMMANYVSVRIEHLPDVDGEHKCNIFVERNASERDLALAVIALLSELLEERKREEHEPDTPIGLAFKALDTMNQSLRITEQTITLNTERA